LDKIFSKKEEAPSSAASKSQPNPHQSPFGPAPTSKVTGADTAPTINTNLKPGTGHVKQPIQNKSSIPGVKNIIAVASGKVSLQKIPFNGDNSTLIDA